MPSSVQDSIKMIMRRLDNMESRMDKEFQTINARLTIMEGKVKFVESNQQKDASSNNEQKSVTPKRSVTPASTENGDAHGSFSKSTIGSSALPISLTPGPMMQHGQQQRKA